MGAGHSLSLSHSQWNGLSLTGDSVTFEPFPQSPPYLQSLDIEVGFIKRGREIAEVFSADEMTQNFVCTFNGVVFAMGKILLFEFYGQTIQATVKGVRSWNFPGSAGTRHAMASS